MMKTGVLRISNNSVVFRDFHIMLYKSNNIHNRINSAQKGCVRYFTFLCVQKKQQLIIAEVCYYLHMW